MPDDSRFTRIRFDDYEIDLKEAEVRKAGLPLKLAPQPFRILALLASRPGETVAREEIQRAVWGGETFVDFEVGLNQCIRQIRGALGDDAQHPRFIETMSRRGYRFIAPLVASAVEEDEALSHRVTPVQMEAGVESTGVLTPAPAAAKAGDFDEPTLQPRLNPPKLGGRALRRRGMWALAAGLAIAILVVAVYGAGLRSGGLFRGLFRTHHPDSIRSLAVLPFRNLSGDSSQDYFAEGMTDQLITELARIRELRVISRTSVTPYAETRKALPAIARELHVDAVVEGSVMRSGNRVTVTAQLVQAQPERHVWAKSFERPAGDALSLQGEIAEEIASEIQINLTPQEKTKLALHSRESPAAQEAYLRGQFYLQRSQAQWNQNALPSLKQSILQFERAIQLDPHDAEAYSGLATAYDALLSRDSREAAFQPAEISEKVKRAAVTALQLDPGNARARVALGWVRFVYDWDWSGAGAEFQQAVAAVPSYAASRGAYAMYLCAMGRTDEAISQIRLAEDLDPVSWGTRLAGGWVYYHARRYYEAVQENRAAVTLAPESPRAHDALGWTMVKRGLYQQAAAEFQTAAKLSGDAETFDAYTAYLDAVAGKRSEALLHLRNLESRRSRPTISSYVRAEIYAALDDHDRAFANLSEACDQRSFEMVYLRSDPDLDPLRSDPRFTALERRMKLPL